MSFSFYYSLIFTLHVDRESNKAQAMRNNLLPREKKIMIYLGDLENFLESNGLVNIRISGELPYKCLKIQYVSVQL